MSRIIRSPENQKKHKKKMRILSVVIFLCIGALVWLVVYIPSLPSLQIKNILVRGNKVLTEEEIKQKVSEELSGKYLRVFPETNVFLYPQKMAEEGLIVAFPRIANVSANLDTERILTISLTEREPFALWCGREMPTAEADKSCAYLDENGFVFARAPNFSGNAYFEFYGKGVLSEGEPTGHDFLSPDSFRRVWKTKEELEGFRVSPVKIFVAEDGHAEFIEALGYGIRFNIDQDTDALLGNMRAVFHSNEWGEVARSGTLEYLDFRFGNKVYYKFKTQK